MQTIAREFNLSETIFVMAPRDPGPYRPRPHLLSHRRDSLCRASDHRLRHPPGRDGASQGDFATTITLEEEAGLVPVAVSRQGGRTLAELTAPVLPYAARRHAGHRPSGRRAGVHADDIGPHRPGVHEGGPRFLYIRRCAAWTRWPAPARSSRTGRG
jgi:trans-2,3-dihydro-3-hydroxyanthranilate isomerase